MTQFLGRQDSVESLRRDLIDLQGAILEVFSRTGPVRFPSWKFPDKASCNLDLVSLLEQYDFVDGDDEFNQHSHIVLLELVIDRLLLLLQSFNVYAEQLKSGHKRQHSQQKERFSVGLVARHYWSNLVQLGNQKDTSKDIVKVTKTKKLDSEENTRLSSALSLISSRSDLGPRPLSASSSTSSFTFIPQNRVSVVSSPCPTQKVPCCLSVVSTNSHNVSCQTVESSLVPCDACDQVQSILRQTGDALVDLCQNEGLPSSLQRFLVAVDDTLDQGHQTAGDIAQWAKEQDRDMGRLGKHLQEVRGTVQPLKDKLVAAEKERARLTSQLERARSEVKRGMAKHQATVEQLEHTLQEAQKSIKEMERRLEEEQQLLKKETLSLEDNNLRLKKELSLQHETLHVLECERNDLQSKVKTLQIEEEAHRNLEERTQLLESQVSNMQLLLDKEIAKYQSACRQQESMQAKQKSLLERMDALDQECEELQRQLADGEERQTDLQDQLNHISGEKEQLLAQLTQQQALCRELQEERQRLETRVGELQNSVDQLRGEVEDSAQRERLLVAFPELNPQFHAQPQSTGNVLEDMERQLRANCVRIGVLEQENSTLHNTLVKLRGPQQDTTKETSPEKMWSHCLPTTPAEEKHSLTSQIQHSPLQSGSTAQLNYSRRRGSAGGGDGASELMGPWDHASTAASSSSTDLLPSLLLHQQTLHLNPDTSAAKTYARIRQASRFRGLNQRRK